MNRQSHVLEKNWGLTETIFNRALLMKDRLDKAHLAAECILTLVAVALAFRQKRAGSAPYQLMGDTRMTINLPPA
jgi:hypothetical protein